MSTMQYFSTRASQSKDNTVTEGTDCSTEAIHVVHIILPKENPSANVTLEAITTPSSPLVSWCVTHDTMIMFTDMKIEDNILQPIATFESATNDIQRTVNDLCGAAADLERMTGSLANDEKKNRKNVRINRKQSRGGTGWTT